MENSYPPRADYESVSISANERAHLDFREKCLDEFRSTREQLGVNGREDRAARFLTPDGQWPKDIREKKSYLAMISINVIRSIVERKTGALTESKAQMNVTSRRHDEIAAKMIQKVIAGVWDERGVQEALTDGIIMAQRGGNAPCLVTWNQNLDYGMGDVDVEFVPNTQVAFQPSIRRASDLQRAEWVIINNVRAVAEFPELYPRRGHLVKPSKNLSTYDARYGKGKIDSPVAGSLYSVWKRGSRDKDHFKNSAIPLATETLHYFRDRTLNPERTHFENGAPNYLFPRKRLIVSAGDLVLYDSSSKYWDGLYPLEILDWGIEVDHPFGESEVDLYRSIQEGINYLISGTVQNAALLNDPPKKTTPNIDPLMRDDLEDHGREPGRVWTFDSLNDVADFNINPYGAQILTVVKTLMDAVEFMSGMSEVTSGRTPNDVSASAAIEQLITAAQTILRLQGRAIEKFLGRLGQLLASRIIQYYTGERIFNYFGQDGETMQAVWKRAEFIKSLSYINEEDIDKKLQQAFRDFTVNVTPLSSLESARQRDLQLKLLLKQLGVIPSIEVSRAARINEPEERLKEAKAEKMEELQAMIALRAAGGGKGQQRAPGKLGRAPQDASPLRAGIGGS